MTLRATLDPVIDAEARLSTGRDGLRWSARGPTRQQEEPIMAELTGKAAAAAALKAMVEDRKTLVEALGEAVDHHRKAADAVAAAQRTEADAAETVRT